MAGGRRDKGSGGLSKLADGAWQASYYDAGGVRRFLRGKTQREAREKLAAAIKAAASGVAAAPSKERLGEYLVRWLDIIRGSVTERTHRGYRDHIEKRIAPALGAIRLQALSETQIDRFYARLSETKLAPATVRRIHATLQVAHENAAPCPKSPTRCYPLSPVRVRLGCADARGRCAAGAVSRVRQKGGE